MVKLKSVKAKELMKTDIVELSVSAPIQEAIETFEEYHISGAPVVNSAGEIVGVLSVSDIVKTEHIRDGGIETARETTADGSSAGEADGEIAEEETFYSKEEYSSDDLSKQSVADWMTERVVSVSPEDSLKDVCEIMNREQIHRVFVVENRKPVGVLSTMDVIGYLANS